MHDNGKAGGSRMRMLNWAMKSVVLFSVGILLVVGLGTTACSKREQSAPTPAPKPTAKVTLAASKNLWTSLALVAKAKGYFAEEGLDLTVAYQDGGRYCMDALLSKSADFATVVEVNVAYIGFAGNQNVTVIGSIVESTSCGIVARKSAGIQSPADLKGKSLAFSPGTGSELFATRFLAANGIAREDVQLRKLQPKAIQGAMVAKEVDAAATWDPFIENSRRALGDDAVTFFDPKAYVGYMHVAVRRDWAAQNPEAVKGFLRAVKKAAAFVKAEPAAAQGLLAQETAMNLDLVQAIWGYFDFRLNMDSAKLATAVADVAGLIKANEEAFKDKPMPDYRSFFDDRFFRETIR